ncbi:hypothetical protein N4G40_15680 [Pantoea eucrina]|uniref:Uncharacterized protein n=1 Tax=Pantoea eucrina TaxID=472693 RepID=A0ABU5LIE7_9GAMM|nr:hypothetical protein [Pantoea eucrina]MDZ7279695.1 hypothetical protein [Pantoea eucrina]
MLRNEELKKLAEVIFSAKTEADGDILTLNFQDTPSVDLNFIKNKVLDFGYNEEPIIEGECLLIKTGSRYFRDDSIIYTSLNNLWLKACSLGKVPDEFIVLRDNISSSSDSYQENCISVFLKWSQILKSVSNHSHKEKFIIYLPSDEGGKELVVISHERLDLVLNVRATPESSAAADELLKILNISDAQEKERKSIIRNSIYDFLNTEDDKSIGKLITLGERVYHRYNDLLELYTNRFSVNKLLSEIETKNLEYTSKINDFISSSQTKAFAIPGALIAIGGIAKSNGFLDSLLILIGLFYVYYITYMSNQVLNESYTSLKDDIKKSFSRYDKFEEGIEVKEAAKNIYSRLVKKIESAQDRLIKVNGIAKGMLWIGAIYLISKWLFIK